MTCRYKENGSRVVRAQIIYTLNGNAQYEEWFRAPAELLGNGTLRASLPEGTTHYYINLIDEHRFLVSYPEVVPASDPSLGKIKKFAPRALVAR